MLDHREDLVVLVGRHAVRADELPLLEDHGVDGERDLTLLLAGCEADLEVLAGLAQRVDGVAAGLGDPERVDAHVRAAALGRVALDRLRDVLDLRDVHGGVGAEFLRLPELLVGQVDGDDVRAEGVGDVDRREADAAAAVDGHPVAGGDVHAVDQPVEGGREPAAEPGDLHGVDPVGQRHDVVVGLADRELLGERPRLEGDEPQRDHALADVRPPLLAVPAGPVAEVEKLDKIAVKTGGGYNHRMGLHDMALVKENHIRLAGGIKNAVDNIRDLYPNVKIEVETTNLSEVDEALNAGADMIMLDNMNTETMRKAVEKINKRAMVEASGNMNTARLREVAETGVDFISVGALTHSVEAFDISQQITKII